jgi:hypothetical protein
MTTPAPSLREQILNHIHTVTLPGTVFCALHTEV